MSDTARASLVKEMKALRNKIHDAGYSAIFLLWENKDGILCTDMSMTDAGYSEAMTVLDRMKDALDTKLEQEF